MTAWATFPEFSYIKMKRFAKKELQEPNRKQKLFQQVTL